MSSDEGGGVGENATRYHHHHETITITFIIIFVIIPITMVTIIIIIFTLSTHQYQVLPKLAQSARKEPLSLSFLANGPPLSHTRWNTWKKLGHEPLNPLTHSFIQPTFIENLLCAKH